MLAIINEIGVKRKAPVRANHVRSTITGIFRYALEVGVIATPPTFGLPKKFKERPRERFLNNEEIVDFWNATEKEKPVIRALFRILLLLGQRSGETRAMRYEDIKNGLWTIPSANTKSGKTQRVPISYLAQSEIDSLSMAASSSR